MQRKVVSTTEIKARLNDHKQIILVKFPQEASKPRMEKIKSGLINPERSYTDPFKKVACMQLKPSSARIQLQSPEKKYPSRVLPERQHLRSPIPYSRKQMASPNSTYFERSYSPKGLWNVATRSNIDHSHVFKNLPPANFFSTETQRKIISCLFLELEDIMDNQRFSTKMKRILKEKENQIDDQKRYKRFKRKNEKDSMDKVKDLLNLKKSVQNSDSELTLSKQYKLIELWEIWKTFEIKQRKASQHSVQLHEEVRCEEFIRFVNDVGFEDQLLLRQYFEEMSTKKVAVRRGTLQSQEGVHSTLKMTQFITNFSKYIENNMKIMYLHNQTAAFQRNVNLKNYLSHWHQFRQKIRQKEKQELRCIGFLREVQSLEEDDIMFELEDMLNNRMKTIQNHKNTNNEAFLNKQAIDNIEVEIKRARVEIRQVYDALKEKVLTLVEYRDRIFLQKRCFCDLLRDVEIFRSLREFIQFLEENRADLIVRSEYIDRFEKEFLGEKKLFGDSEVSLVEIVDYMFRANYNKEQTTLLSRLVEILKRKFRVSRGFSENQEVSSAQKMKIDLLIESYAEFSAKFAVQKDFLDYIQQKMITFGEKQLTRVANSESKSVEMNFVYSYLLTLVNQIDAKMELSSIRLDKVVQYIEEQIDKYSEDLLDPTEHDVDNRYHNQLENMLFQIYELLGEDTPQDLVFLIDTRSFKIEKFRQLLLDKYSLTDFLSPIPKQETIKGNPQEDISQITSNRDSFTPQNRKITKTFRRDNENDEEEDEFLISLMNKKQAKTATEGAPTEGRIKFTEGARKGSPEGTRKGSSEGTRKGNPGVAEEAMTGRSMTGRTITGREMTGISQQTEVPRNVNEERLKTEAELNTQKNSLQNYGLFDADEDELEAQEIISNIKNNSLRKQKNDSQKNLYSSKFDSFKVNLSPEYYNIRNFKDDDSYKVYQNQRSTKLPHDIDSKVQNFQLQVQLDDAKRHPFSNRKFSASKR